MKNVLCIWFLILFAACEGKHSQKAIPGAISISDPTRQASCVSLTKDENGMPVISWCETDTSSGTKYFFLSHFDSGSGRFGSSINVPIKQSASIHEEGMPKIAFKKDGTILAVYETSEPTKENGFAGFLYYTQSTDKGRTWSAPAYLSNRRRGTSQSFASLAVLSDGEIGTCWLAEAFQPSVEGRPVFFARTKPSGGFENEILIDSTACECCRTAISANEAGRITIMYRGLSENSIRDIAIATSDDDGHTFSVPLSFSHDDWQINGCPHNGPSVVTADKVTLAAWYTGGAQPGIYFARINNQDGTVAKKYISPDGRFAQVCLLPGDENLIAYNRIRLRGDSVASPVIIEKIEDGRSFSKKLTAEDAGASYPVVIAAGKSAAIVAWKEHHKIIYQVVDVHDIREPAVAQEPVEDRNQLSFLRKELHEKILCNMPAR